MLIDVDGELLEGLRPFWIEEWDDPAIGIYFADCPLAGHDMFCLHYRDCGAGAESKVVHVDQKRITRSLGSRTSSRRSSVACRAMIISPLTDSRLPRAVSYTHLTLPTNSRE